MAADAMIDAEVYLAQQSAVERAERVIGIVQAWHRDAHQGGFVACQENPCLAINRERAAADTDSISGL